MPPDDPLPERLTITLWDFSWYVRTGPGEPFADLDAAFAQAVERGYNTVRICAMPFLLFGSGLDTAALALGPLGGDFAQRMRWYDVKEPTTIDAREHLLALFRAARRHGCFVIVSSWEYQQSSAFAADPAWWDALSAVPPAERPGRLAAAHADLLDLLVAEGLDDRVAFTEIHNEVQVGHLADGLPTDADPVVALRPLLQEAVEEFHRRHPGRRCTVNYARVPHESMRGIPENVDVLAVHPYIYGVLDALIDEFGLRRPVAQFPQERAAHILRPGAPPAAGWTVPAEHRWRLDATIVSAAEAYVHDWADPVAFDRWLYDHYGEHRIAMAEKLRFWFDVAADWAAAHDVPVVLGEGWVGYTPLHGTFEEGPVGAEICRQAVTHARRIGAWGTVVCSNAAPQHPMWSDVALQQECNALFSAASAPRTSPVFPAREPAPRSA
ncbi:cellulase-like family protein [Pseudonocardia xinjiangensis]|uniref:cellulase-like family protein n=1 Tax=Pseudonocardia xinjiangensis TaxID=75289 RepID=UPI003D9358F6